MGIRSEFPDLPPLWALAVIGLQWLVSVSLPIVSLGNWAVVTGRLAIALGLLLALWSALWFRRQKTPIEPGERPRSLITEGPFRLNRNPIYTGMALVVLGVGLLMGTLSAVLLSVLFPLIVDRRHVRREEAALRAAFGSETDAYFAQTRRW